MNILVVEDEPLTVQFIKQTLQAMKHRVWCADNSSGCKNILECEVIDLVFMDINIKGSVDGLQLALDVTNNYQASIIFVTSYRDTDTINEASLSKPLGFLIKPVIKSDIEAIMMVASTQHKADMASKTSNSNIITIGALKFDKKTKNVTCSDENIKISKLEKKALEIFLHNPNIVLSSEELLDEIWGDKRSKSSLRELISRLRKKLPKLKLENYSNIGYILHT
jgi:DNA-binding response OmpR family regulator